MADFTGKKAQFLNMKEDGLKLRSSKIESKKKYNRKKSGWKKETW